MKLKWYIDKTRHTIKKEGFKIFFLKTKYYIQNRFKKAAKQDNDSICADVLFINGTFLPHPARYRVTHQKEQLFAYNVTSSEVFYEDLKLEYVKQYRVFVFFRCPITDEIEEFITLARKYNKKVLFDIDDLVIDKKYTSQIKYLKNMTADELKLYDEGVSKIQTLLKKCDAAITSTEKLAEELKNYVPEVFINRNTASQDMVKYSIEAVKFRDELPFKSQDKIQNKQEFQDAIKAQNERKGKIRIGYFSGSITHNDDFEYIAPVIKEIMEKYSNVELHITGELDIPEQFNRFKERIISRPFTDWQKLPMLISSVDINIAPLIDNIFNEAKSEIKWIEASLVKVPTIASNIGAFKKMIVNNETGLLCNTIAEWKAAFELLINNEKERKRIAENAYKFTIKHCNTVYTGLPLTKFIKSKMNKNIVFILPSIKTSGGALVVFKHCKIMQDNGYDVLIINNDVSEKDILIEGNTIPVISSLEKQIHFSIDKCVATLWTTNRFMDLYPNIKERYYFVQNFETDFYEQGHYWKFLANQTYIPIVSKKMITISKWCQQWLKDDYEQHAEYVPNGIDIKRFYPVKRNFNKEKIIVLVEGNSADFYKNVDESFEITNKLDRNKYEVWFMSYLGKPKPWYKIDKFLHQVPHDKVAEVYRSVDILIKSSILESFSYPPLEMMATGGYVVVAPNGGNIEFLTDMENCVMYEQGNIESGIKAVETIVENKDLRNKLYENGIKTAEKRDWASIEKDIVNLYK